MSITIGYLTKMLKKEYQEGGWDLTEDEDFVYLIHPDGTTTVFNAHAVTIGSIEEVIARCT